MKGKTFAQPPQCWASLKVSPALSNAPQSAGLHAGPERLPSPGPSPAPAASASEELPPALLAAAGPVAVPIAGAPVRLPSVPLAAGAPTPRTSSARSASVSACRPQEGSSWSRRCRPPTTSSAERHSDVSTMEATQAFDRPALVESPRAKAGCLAGVSSARWPRSPPSSTSIMRSCSPASSSMGRALEGSSAVASVAAMPPRGRSA
mmetsp:Transcript_21377/g.60747  ORF Transcript_21377/g.60747 Transcript_21377/m.60747 type:complete len:206 (-) Transcript_21377:76-693(-)